MTSVQFSSVTQSCLTLAIPLTAACQAPLFITNSRSLYRLISIVSMVPSNQLILCHPSTFNLSQHQGLFQWVGSSPVSWFFPSGGQSIGVSASTSVFPMNIQDWFPLALTGWISLQSKGLSRVVSNTTVQKHQFFGAQLSSQSNSHIHTWPLEKP